MVEGPLQMLYETLDQSRWHWRSWDELKSMSWFTRINYTNFFLFIFFVVFAIYQARSKVACQSSHQMLSYDSNRRNQQKAQQQGRPNSWLQAPGFPDIQELQGFSWSKEEPLKLRIFKPKYHLTMDFDETALQKLNPSEYVLMDRNYAERIDHRKKTMKEHHDTIIGVNNDGRIRDAVQELYTWLMGTYLPKRYSNMFKLHLATFETGDMYMLENLVTKAILPAKPEKNANTITLLDNLCKTLDEDFLFLVPEEAEEGKENEAKYVLEAHVVVGVSGWDPRDKIGQRLAQIHTPVPGYSKYLEGSMDRYFNKVEVGDYIKRTNWTIMTHGNLFSPASGSTHAYEGDEVRELQEVDLDNTFLRSERQTLHRLPKSKALVFAFKTYLESIKEIKQEGFGEEVAQAIDGLQQGNVPGMLFYKRGVEWGAAVKRYLRS